MMFRYSAGTGLPAEHSKWYRQNKDGIFKMYAVSEDDIYLGRIAFVKAKTSAGDVIPRVAYAVVDGKVKENMKYSQYLSCILRLGQNLPIDEVRLQEKTTKVSEKIGFSDSGTFIYHIFN